MSKNESVCIYSQLEALFLIRGRFDDRGRASATRPTWRSGRTIRTATDRAKSGSRFAICLGFELLPRLKAIASQARVWLRKRARRDTRTPAARAVPADRLEADRGRQYDEMVKYATALRLGTAEAEAILRRFTRGDRPAPDVQGPGGIRKGRENDLLMPVFPSTRHSDARSTKGSTWSSTGTAPTASFSSTAAARYRATAMRGPGTEHAGTALAAALPWSTSTPSWSSRCSPSRDSRQRPPGWRL